jgi:hypothetical protein
MMSERRVPVEIEPEVPVEENAYGSQANQNIEEDQMAVRKP